MRKQKITRKQVIEYLEERLDLLEQRQEKRFNKYGFNSNDSKVQWLCYVVGMLKNKEI